MSEFAFRKSSRLLAGHEFQRVFADAKYKISHRHLLILARPNTLARPRLGLVIGKKNIRLAVQRNRIKRHIRDSFRLRQHNLPHVDVIVLARRELDQLSDEKLQSLLDKQWARLCQQVSRDRLPCAN
ncbi:ribonuclease P protein component [Proteobacteria bacterium 005FR1]|nr:ribonuclease P protein component [Proteobacteria bacterium 005FR1]